MNKKVDSSKKNIDSKEDLEIRKVAEQKKDYTQTIILVMLISLFIIGLAVSITIINNFYRNKNNKENGEIIKISTPNYNCSIVNNGDILENIDDSIFGIDKTYIVEKINSIEISTNKGSLEDDSFTYDLRYDITENDFYKNLYAYDNSEVLVRFSYSYDLENWQYINNVITVNDSNISPLIGNYYDIAGVVANLKVLTNQTIDLEESNNKKIYWRSETLFQNKDKNDVVGKFKASFRIEYKESV